MMMRKTHPIGRVKSIIQDRKRTLAGPKFRSNLERIKCCVVESFYLIRSRIHQLGYMSGDAGRFRLVEECMHLLIVTIFSMKGWKRMLTESQKKKESV